MAGNYRGNKMTNVAIKLVIKMTEKEPLTQCLSLIHGHSILVKSNDNKVHVQGDQKMEEKSPLQLTQSPYKF